MKKRLIHNAQVINEGEIFRGAVLVEGDAIGRVLRDAADVLPLMQRSDIQPLDAGGCYLFPGVIDDQVHFREPGLTHKADLSTESRAAVAGGVTSFMEMPNTVPNALTQELLEAKYELAAKKSMANYSFYMGVSNDNLGEVLRTDPARVCGVKVFLGSSTGNMLVENPDTLEKLFAECPVLLAAHCEDERTIRANTERFSRQYGTDIPVRLHPAIRSAEACYRSSSMAVELASRHGTRFHVLHISTEKELGLFSGSRALGDKRITAEACIHHLWFSDADYAAKGNFIKWNPAVKTAADRQALLQGVLDGRIDVIATDHAPHTKEEKMRPYAEAPSGGPLVQHSLTAMVELHIRGKISLETIAEKMCHAPAVCFGVARRGFIREGYKADLALVDIHAPRLREVSSSNILYKCGWSPFEGQMFGSTVTHTFVNGRLVYENGNFDEAARGERLAFDR